MIPYGRQDINQADIDAIIGVLRSDFLTQGPMVTRFEQAVAAHTGARHAVAVNSATSALHIACMALGLGPGDYLWTTPITFVASANCALYCGAQVDFVDIDPLTYNMSIEALEIKLAIAEKAGKLPKILVPVHLCGQPCDMSAIRQFSEHYGFKVIEDASHAIGGRYKNDPIGNCRFSDITVFSFHPVKVVTTGEGGMAMTNDPVLAQAMNLFRSHGITRDQAQMTHQSEGAWYYEQVTLGFNYRMTDIQAALGVSQMSRLEGFVSLRHALAERYDEKLKGLPITTPWQHPDGYSGLHLYVIRAASGNTGISHRCLFDTLRENGIGVNLHYIPVHCQPYFQNMGFKCGQFPASEAYYREAISLPLYTQMTEVQQDNVIDALTKALQY
jgi:UDP-4-amino-4,6-dideoxy-N-acetyl-beta-L-altrosamine transaminase